MLIIIPCRNEESNIIKVAKTCLKYSDVIVINDNSNDKSEELLLKNKIKYIKNINTMGYEQSLLIGIRYALKNNYKSFCTIDGDGEISPNEIKRITDHKIKNNIIIGSRNIKRRFIEKLISNLYKFKHGIHDPYCGLKFFKFYDNYKIPKSKLDTYSLKIIDSFLNPKSNIFNLPIDIKYMRKNSRLGGSIQVNLKLLISFLLYKSWKVFN